jgi:death-on-curing protein
MIYLDLEILLELIKLYLPKSRVADMGLLESALARPRASAFGEDVYEDIHEKVAAMTISLVKNHCLNDGNKRLGLISLITVLRANKYAINSDFYSTYEFIIKIAETTNPDVKANAAWIRANSEKL